MLAQGIVEDVTMMYGKAEYLIVRYTHEEAFPEGPVALPELRATIQSAINSLLGAAIAS